MERIYNLVKSWYDDNYIDDAQWQEFCVTMLETLMEDNNNVLTNLKNIYKKHLTNNTKYVIIYIQ